MLASCPGGSAAPELDVVVALEEALRGAEGLKGKDRVQVRGEGHIGGTWVHGRCTH